MKIEGSNSLAHNADYDNSDGRAECNTISGHYGVPLGTKHPQNGKTSGQKSENISIRNAIEERTHDLKGT